MSEDQAAAYKVSPASKPTPRKRADRKETRQIKEAFIDGYLSACGGDEQHHLAAAEAAWRDENVTKP